MRKPPPTPNADSLARITRILRIMAFGVPFALAIMLAVDGLDWTDVSVIALTTAVLWLFVGIASFTVGALRTLENPPKESSTQ